MTAEAFERAVSIARQRLSENPRAVDAIAGDAVAHAYCVCATDGEDAAEGRLSDVHRALIDDVADRLRRDAATAGEPGEADTWL